MQPFVGTIVLFNVGTFDHPKWRPGIVVAVSCEKCVNLLVFYDGLNDGRGTETRVGWETGILHGRGAREWQFAHEVFEPAAATVPVSARTETGP